MALLRVQLHPFYILTVQQSAVSFLYTYMLKEGVALVKVPSPFYILTCLKEGVALVKVPSPFYMLTC